MLLELLLELSIEPNLTFPITIFQFSGMNLLFLFFLYPDLLLLAFGGLFIWGNSLLSAFLSDGCLKFSFHEMGIGYF